jgi:RimJ/RimL family protein N-acetyltransferase
LETERLLLRPHVAADFERVAELFASERSRYIGGPLDRNAAWRGFAADVGQWALLGFGALAIEDKVSGEYIGQVGLNFPEQFPERELGWILFEEFESRGYALEAALRAREYAYGTLGWQTAVSYIAAQNTRSIRLAERLGAAVDPEARMPDGLTCLVYRHPPNVRD